MYHVRGDNKCKQNLDWKTSREETSWEKRHRWGDNIKMDLKEIGCEGVDWIQVAQVESSGSFL
jgi:hypothetical protein